MTILQSTDYSKFERFSNVADELSARLVSSFLECEVLVAVHHRYDFEFLIKAFERKRRTEDSNHIHEIEIIDNQKVKYHFKVTLGIRTIKSTW